MPFGLHFGESPETFVLQKQIRQGTDPGAWETMQEFSAQEYKDRAPTVQECEDYLDEGYTYRMAVKIKGHSTPVPDTRYGGWFKRIKAKSTTSSKNIGKIFDDAVKPLEEATDGFAKMVNSINNLYYALHPEIAPSEGGEATDGQTPQTALAKGLSPLEAAIQDAKEKIRVYSELGLVKQYDPSNPYNGLPPPSFTGSAPWFMHPMIMGPVFNETLSNIGDQAQEIGYKFYRGARGNPPQTLTKRMREETQAPSRNVTPNIVEQPPQQQQQVIVDLPKEAHAFENEDNVYEDMLNKRIEERDKEKRKNEPVTQKRVKRRMSQTEEEEPPAPPSPTPPESEKPSAPSIITMEEDVPQEQTIAA